MSADASNQGLQALVTRCEAINNPPAFPMQDAQAIHCYAAAKIVGVEGVDERDRIYTKARWEAIGGLSMRDYFAAKVMQGFAADPNTNGDEKIIAAVAYQWADAMLAAREARP